MEPLRYLSIRQPFAELILRGIKDVENRSQVTHHRGRLVIHASSQVNAAAMAKYGLEGPELVRGAMIGVVDLVDSTSERGSAWHQSGRVGWYFANPRRFARPIPYSANVGLQQTTRPSVFAAVASARRVTQDVLNVFSFGYWGWGGEPERLIRIMDAVEASRGFERPLLVDIRLKRTVRAEGFRDDALERLLGFERYRWFRTLGNRSIATGKDRIEISSPDSAEQLLDLALDAQRDGRRVIFFCACETPAACHRHKVAELVLRAARRRGVLANVAEWPGTPTPTGVAATLRVSTEALDAALDRGGWLLLPRTLTWAELGLLSYGSVLRLRATGRSNALIVAGALRPRGERHVIGVLWSGTENEDEWDVTVAARAGRRERFRGGYAPLA